MADKKKQNDDEQKLEDNPKLEQNKKEEPMSTVGKTITTGFVGGVFWSLLAYFSYILNFTEISPNLILQPFALGDWKDRTLGHLISIVILGLVSIGVALAYFAILKRFKSLWIGVAFGGALWALVFFVLNPIFPNLDTVFELPRGTVVTTLCLYILYGAFVGYSISFDYNEFQANPKS
ncbi:YqhR family membrane protein [Metabacillus litoralis]|uniref:YqhR family membrane protein n=1 Tax=Metabacillus litoralis TaxID=152268 RepID=UPI000EF62D01|nr:YqhR family membrane protein [Metabacillus litoralis]